MILPTCRIILTGTSFFKQRSKTLEIPNQLIHFPDKSLQLREANGKNNCDIFELRAAERTERPPYQETLNRVCTKAEIGTTTSTADATSTTNRKHALLVNPGVVKLEKDCTTLKVTNPNNQIFANFTILTTNQAKRVKPVEAEHLSLLTQKPNK